MIIWNAMDIIGLAILGIAGIIGLLIIGINYIRIKCKEIKNNE